MKTASVVFGFLGVLLLSACNNADINITGLRTKTVVVPPPPGFNVDSTQALTSNSGNSIHLNAAVRSVATTTLTSGSITLKAGVVR